MKTLYNKNEQLNQALLGPLFGIHYLCLAETIIKECLTFGQLLLVSFPNYLSLHVRNIDHWTNYWFETTITKGYFISQEPIIHLHLV